MDIEELAKLVIYAILLLVLIGIVIVLFKGKGGDIIASIRNLFRFGG